MSAGMLLLTILAILVFCGLLQRVLDRMYLTDRQALAIIACMLVGTFLPNIPLGSVQVNVSGAIVPLAICIYLFWHTDTSIERWRILWGALLTGGAVYILSRCLPAEAEQLLIEPMWLYGLCGGVIAWLLGRSRRGAFICGVSGVVFADIATSVVSVMQGYQPQLTLGGAGIADAIVISGVLAVFVCELVGESVERVSRSTKWKGERET